MKSAYDLDKRDKSFMVAVGTGVHGDSAQLRAMEMNAACDAWLEKRGLRSSHSFNAAARMTRLNAERRARQ